MPHSRGMRIFLALVPLSLAAAESAMPPVPILAVPRLAAAPAMTASVDDPAWAAAVTISELPPCWTDHGPGQAGAATRVQLGWMPEALFVRFTCSDSDIFAPVQGRDAARSIPRRTGARRQATGNRQ